MEFDFNYSEIYETLDKLEHSLLEYEKEIVKEAPDTTHIHIIFRHAHTLKGILGIIQKMNCSRLIHHVESAFDEIRHGRQSGNNQLIEKSLQAIDCIRQSIETDTDNNAVTQPLSEQFTNIFDTTEKANSNTDSFAEFPLTHKEQNQYADCKNEGYDIYVVEKLINNRIRREVYENLPIYEELRKIGVIISIYPTFEQVQQADDEAVLRILFASKEKHETLNFVIFDPIRKIFSSETFIVPVNRQMGIDPTHIQSLIYCKNFKQRWQISDVFAQLGNCHTANSVTELVEAITTAIDENRKYDFLYIDSEILPQIKNTILRLRCHEMKRQVLGFNSCKIITRVNNLHNHFANQQHLEGYIYTTKEINKQNLPNLLNCLYSMKKNILTGQKTVYEIFEMYFHSKERSCKTEEVSTIVKQYAEKLNVLLLKLEAENTHKLLLNKIFQTIGNLLVTLLHCSKSMVCNLLAYTLFLIETELEQDEISDQSIDILYSVIELLSEFTFTPSEEYDDKIIEVMQLIIAQLPTDEEDNDVVVFDSDYNLNEIELEDGIVIFADSFQELSTETNTEKPLPTPTINDAKEQAFVEQITQYMFMLDESVKKYPENSDLKPLIKRALNGLIKACKYKNEKKILQFASQALELLEENKEMEAIIAQLQNAIQNYDPASAQVEIETAPQPLESAAKLIEIEKKDDKEHQTASAESKTFRINEQKVDNFYNLVSELLIARNTYDFLINEHIGKERLNSLFKPLTDNLHLLSRLTYDLQAEVLQLRLIPINQVFKKFSRLIYDISKQTNKKIEMTVNDDDIEIDKKVADMLSDPLLHLIRNACDHGIESADQRIKAGKTESGNINISTSKTGSNLLIRITDDGRGINKEAIWEKARKMNYDLSGYTDDNILNIIFMPGFSTAKIISDISGRGVGMDVVKTTIDKLNGKISVETQLNVGTEIRMLIPVSIGISKVLLVEAGQNQYAIPFEAIVENVRINANLIKQMHQRAAFHYRQEMIVALPLSHLIERKFKFNAKSLDPNSEVSMVLLKTRLGKIAVMVDKLKNNLDLAVKPLPDAMKNVEIFSGVSILGNGKVVLVLNPEALVVQKEAEHLPSTNY